MRKVILAAIMLCGTATGCLYQKDSTPTANSTTSSGSALNAYGEAMAKVVAATGTAGNDWTAKIGRPWVRPLPHLTSY